MEIETYQKTIELMNRYGIRVKTAYIRTELKLYGHKKIKSQLGTCKLYELTDEAIDNWYSSWMTKNVVKTNEKKRPELLQEIRDIINECHKYYHWASQFIGIIEDHEEAGTRSDDTNRYGYLIALDQQDIFEAIRTDKSLTVDQKKNMCRSIRNVLNDTRVVRHIQERPEGVWKAFYDALSTPFFK